MLINIVKVYECVKLTSKDKYVAKVKFSNIVMAMFKSQLWFKIFLSIEITTTKIICYWIHNIKKM